MEERKFDDVLQECFGLLEQGQATLEECLSRYPEYAAELRVLLTIALEARRVSLPAASPSAYAAARQRAVNALAARKRKPVPSPFFRFREWVAAQFQVFALRKPATRLAYLAALLLVMLAGSLVVQSLRGTTTVQAATLTSASGPVEVLPAGSSSWQPLAVGQRVAVGERVRVGQPFTATLTFFGGATTELQSSADVYLLQMSGDGRGRAAVIVLQQSSGQTRVCLRCPANLALRFEIETPAAIIVAHATEFTVIVEDDGATAVSVLEGAVDVTGQATTVMLKAGQATSVQPAHPPATAYPIPTTMPADTEAEETEVYVTPEAHGSPEPTRVEEHENTTPEAGESPTPPEAEETEARETRQAGETPEPTQVEEPEVHATPEVHGSPEPTQVEEPEVHETRQAGETPEPTQVEEPEVHATPEVHGSPEPTETVEP